MLQPSCAVWTGTLRRFPRRALPSALLKPAPAGLVQTPAVGALAAVRAPIPAYSSFLLIQALAVKTLELEMEYIFAALEDEALDIGGRGGGACICVSMPRHTAGCCSGAAADDACRRSLLNRCAAQSVTPKATKSWRWTGGAAATRWRCS